MAALRDPATGCPWDQVQTFATIAPYTVEEAYEVADTIARADWTALPDELGDLLFQVIYHARLAEEAGWFTFADVARAISDKMIQRHPHVFGDAVLRPNAWETAKAAERARTNQARTLDGVAASLPALTQAVKITRRAARIGFDWPDASTVLDKLTEEIDELRAELPGGHVARLADELGDVLFVVANLARKLDLDAEACLRQATAKFTRRFNAVEDRLAAEGRAPIDATLADMEAHWRQVKVAEKDTYTNAQSG